MIVVVALLLFGTLKGIDIYTHHGEAVVVPDVKGMTVGEAGTVFGNRGLACVRFRFCVCQRANPRAVSWTITRLPDKK